MYIILLLFYIFIIWTLIRKLKKEFITVNSKRTIPKSMNDKRYSTINSYYSVDTLKSNKDINRKHNFIPDVNILPAEQTFRDDRENDWLAQQLVEERSSYRKTQYMFENSLDIEHSRVCDADKIDTGIGR